MQAWEYRINWKIYTPYAGAAGIESISRMSENTKQEI